VHSMRSEIIAGPVPAPRGHFSHAVRAGDTIYVSGLLALDSTGAIQHPGDPRAQTAVIFDVLTAILAAADATLADVVRLTTYVTDIGARTAVNEVRRAVFGPVRPASTLVGVASLAAPGACVEIDAIAVASD
jgi:2-iminobutanoate/2-iminopropanoate deaminase